MCLWCHCLCSVQVQSKKNMWPASLMRNRAACSKNCSPGAERAIATLSTEFCLREPVPCKSSSDWWARIERRTSVELSPQYLPQLIYWTEEAENIGQAPLQLQQTGPGPYLYLSEGGGSSLLILQAGGGDGPTRIKGLGQRGHLGSWRDLHAGQLGGVELLYGETQPTRR